MPNKFTTPKELTKELFPFKDYTLDDFSKEPFEKRLEIVATAVNHPIRAMVFLALKESKVYTSGREVLEDFLFYLGIPLEEFNNNKSKYKNLMPVSTRTYQAYIDDRIENEGTLTRINMFTKIAITPEEIGYAMTSFGEEMKGFVAFILKKCCELEIDPWKLFGCTIAPKGKRAPVDSIKIIECIDKGLNNSQKIAERCGMGGRPLHNHLKRLEDLGIVKYECLTPRRGERKIHEINKDRLKEFENRIDSKEFKNEIKRKYPYFGKWGVLKKVLLNLSSKDYTLCFELIKEVGSNRATIMNVLSILRNYGVIEEKYGVGMLSRVTKGPKFEAVYNKIIVPIIEVAEEPQKIKEYRGIELTQEEKEGLLEIYSKRKIDWGERTDVVLNLLSTHPEGMLLDEIYRETGFNKGTVGKILHYLKKGGYVYSDGRGRWYYKKPLI
ncbi:MAG: helix-turn-helix domain-containing protein [Nanopusillaceae archaeon]